MATQQEKEYANSLRKEQRIDKVQRAIDPESASTSLMQNNEIDTPESETKAASRLRQSRQGLQAASLGLKFSTKYRWSKGHRAIGMAATSAAAFEEGRGAKGAAKDVALAEVKRRAIRAAVTAVGLAEAKLAVSTVLQGRALGKKLNELADEHRNSVYLFVLMLAVIKDLIDIFTLELLSGFDWVIDLFIYMTLRYFLFGKGRWKVKLFIKIARWFEVIPVSGFLPVWSLCVLYAYFNGMKEAREYRKQAEEINKIIGDKT